MTKIKMKVIRRLYRGHGIPIKWLKAKRVKRKKQRAQRLTKVSEMSKRGGTGCVGDGEGRLDELTPGLWVSQGARMQRMLPDSPWCWCVSRPGIRLAHPHFTLSMVEEERLGQG